MAGGGWIALYRSLEDNWVWDNPTYLKWWLDILFMVNHKEKKVLFDGQLISIGVGERITSEVKLAERWGVSRNTVRKFLDLLVSDQMILLRKSRKSGTWLKVLNYADYQSPNRKSKHQTEHPPAHQTEQLAEHPPEQLTEHKQQGNNDNNDKQSNKIDDDGPNIYQTYQEVFGTLSSLGYQKLTHWANDLSSELVNEALLRSGNAQTFGYTETILKNWEKAGVKNLADVEKQDAKRKKSNRNKAPEPKPNTELNTDVSF